MECTTSRGILCVSCCSERQSQDQALVAIGAGDTLGSDEPAVDWGADVEESDKAMIEAKSAAEKQSSEFPPGFRLKRQDMGDSADSRFVYIAQLYSFSSYVLNKNNTNINFIDVKASKTLLLLVLRHLGSTGTYY